MKKKNEDRLSSDASGLIEQVQTVARFGRRQLLSSSIEQARARTASSAIRLKSN